MNNEIRPDPKTCAILTSMMHVSEKLPNESTVAQPGSFEKIQILQQRASQGLALHHPDDLCIFPWLDDPMPLMQMFGNDTALGRKGDRYPKCMSH